jgi:hypothetical protein
MNCLVKYLTGLIIGCLLVHLQAAAAAPAEDGLKLEGYVRGYSIGRWSVWVKGERRRRSCRLVLQPERFPYDTAPPMLLFEVSPSISAGKLIVRLGNPARSWRVSETTLLADNVRYPFSPLSMPAVAELRENILFEKLLSEKKFYLTWLNEADGGYQSASFEPKDAIAAFKELATACPFHLDPLLGTPSPAEVEEHNQSPSAKFVRAMTYYLHAKYGPADQRKPTISWPPSSQTRKLLLRYAMERNVYISQYLSNAAWNAISREEYDDRQRQSVEQYRSYAEYERHKDWISFVSYDGSTKRCAMATGAYRGNGPVMWQMPHFLLVVTQSSVAPTSAYAYPNPFAPRHEIWASVRREQYRLGVFDNQLMLGARSSDIEEQFMKAIQRSEAFHISGKELETGEDLVLYYSTRGLSEALLKTSQNCARRDILRWLE